MRIKLNWPHIRKWSEALYGFAVLYVGALIFGWHLGPRADELIFCASLPLFVIIPYAALCLVVVLVKSLAIGLQSRVRARRFRRREVIGGVRKNAR